MKAVVTLCFIFGMQLPLKAIDAADDADLRDDVHYLKLNTLKQLENLNTKMEWSLSDRLRSNSNGGQRGRLPTSLIFRDCGQFQTRVLEYSPMDMLKSGVYGIAAGGPRTPVFCDLTNNGGGWTVILRHNDNSIEFNRTWEQYKQGFGDAAGNLWLGNERLHQMTNNGTSYHLRIDMWNFDNKHSFAHYDHFRVGQESDFYRLRISGFKGMIKDSMTLHNNHPFSTFDKYGHAESNCPKKWGGGWWFKNCYHAYLTGKMSKSGWKRSQWKTEEGWTYLKRVEMKLRPANFYNV